MNQAEDRSFKSIFTKPRVAVGLLLISAPIAISFRFFENPSTLAHHDAGDPSKDSSESAGKGSDARMESGSDGSDKAEDPPKFVSKRPKARPESRTYQHVKDRLVVGPGAVANLAQIRRVARYKPKYSLFDEDFLIMPQASDDIGLSDDETAAVQNETQKMLQLLCSEIIRSMKEVSATDDERSYHINAFVEQGDAIFSDYLQRLIQLLGSERAWSLAKSLPVENIAGGMGSYAVDVLVRKPDPQNIVGLTPEEIITCYYVEHKYKDPISGQYVGGGSGGIRSYNKIFLNTLQIKAD